MMALVVCFLDGEELLSFLFDIFHDFFHFVDNTTNSVVDFIIGLCKSILGFAQT